MENAQSQGIVRHRTLIAASMGVLFCRMQGEKKERWMQLAEQAANEQDSEILQELVLEIDRLLEEKQNRLRGDQPRILETGTP